MFLLATYVGNIANDNKFLITHNNSKMFECIVSTKEKIMCKLQDIKLVKMTQRQELERIF